MDAVEVTEAHLRLPAGVFTSVLGPLPFAAPRLHRLSPLLLQLPLRTGTIAQLLEEGFQVGVASGLRTSLVRHLDR
ncbi:MAG: hypothetical protein DI570_22570 [Phenylobacterium zucineum]|nr:MAG: hypothetical protein DI570_22570 [Phenylobacterium zucineum]